MFTLCSINRIPFPIEIGLKRHDYSYLLQPIFILISSYAYTTYVLSEQSCVFIITDG